MNVMRVRMLTALAGRPNYHEGQVVDLDQGVARAWVHAHLAEPVRDDEPETAVALPHGEQAVTRKRVRH